MMIEIRLLSAPGIIRIAVIKQNQLIDFGLWYPGHSDGFGDVYLGRVTSYLPALGGAFVALGKEISGFLSDNAGAKSLHEGDWVAVRITRSAQGGKGVRLDTRNIPVDLIPTEKSIQLIQNGPSLFEEFAEQWPQADILFEDQSLVNLLPIAYKSRMKLAKEPLDQEIIEQIDALETPNVDLPMGMKATITPTPALVAIDMDIAAQTNDNQSKVRAQFNANRIALPPLLQQLRLRNLSGVIILDMAGLPIKKRKLFKEDIETVLSQDPLHPKLIDFTALGLVEILRPRKRPPLHELRYSTHGQAIHILSIIAKELKSKSIPQFNQHITLTTSILIYESLKQDSWTIKDFERHCSASLTLESNPSFTNQQWEYHCG